ncbi:MAG: hypothetical protein BalsKO_26710 [Balneolaceae bacterium]
MGVYQSGKVKSDCVVLSLGNSCDGAQPKIMNGIKNNKQRIEFFYEDIEPMLREYNLSYTIDTASSSGHIF